MTNCNVCIYWDTEPEELFVSTELGENGLCRFNPPVPVLVDGQVRLSLPTTSPETKCGRGVTTVNKTIN